MADAAPAAPDAATFGDGERRGRGRGRRGRGDRRPRNKRDGDDKEWVPCTKLGRLVADGKIKTLEDVYLFSMPVKEYQIIDKFFDDKLKDELMKVSPVQKQTNAGQRTRFKAWIIVGDSDGHVGLGVKCAKEVASAIRGAIIAAKMNTVPIRRGYWGSKLGLPHTVPCKLSGKCGSVRFRCIPAPRGTGLVAAGAARKLLTFAGIQDAYTSSRGSTKTLGNFVHAAWFAVAKSYTYLSPDLWADTKHVNHPFQQYTDFLKQDKSGHKKKHHAEN